MVTITTQPPCKKVGSNPFLYAQCFLTDQIEEGASVKEPRSINYKSVPLLLKVEATNQQKVYLYSIPHKAFTFTTAYRDIGTHEYYFE